MGQSPQIFSLLIMHQLVHHWDRSAAAAHVVSKCDEIVGTSTQVPSTASQPVEEMERWMDRSLVFCTACAIMILCRQELE